MNQLKDLRFLTALIFPNQHLLNIRKKTKKLLIMKTITRTCYYVTTDGFAGHFSPEGYSEFYNDKKNGIEYGHEQCLKHIEQIRQSVYDGKKLNLNSKFLIKIETTVETSLPVS